MGVLATQFLAVVRGKVHHGDGPAGFCYPCGLSQRPLGGLRVVKHLVEHHGIEMPIGKGQCGEIALNQFERGSIEVLQPRAGEPQHLRAVVERGDQRGARRKQLCDAPCAGTDIEQRAEVLIAQSMLQRGFHRSIWAVQAAQVIPLGSVAGKVACRADFTRGADSGEVAAVFAAPRGELCVTFFGHGKEPRCSGAERRGPARTDRAP